MKKMSMCLLALGLMLTGCSSSDSNGGNKDLSQAKIGVIQLMQHEALDASYEGFKDVLVKAGVKEENIDYQVAGDISNCPTVADKLVNGQNDLIYAIATPAAQAIQSKTDSIPVVGCAITDYVTAGLAKSNEKPEGNITGASDLTPVKEQFDLMTQLLPNVKNVAIMYCGSEDNSIFQGNIAQQAAKDKNLNAKVYKVSDSNDIQQVTETIVKDKVDCVYIPTDNLLATYMSSVEAITSPAKIPVICGEEGMCKQGGLATYGLNYTNLGKLAGEQALAILKGEKTPAETPIATLAAEDCTMLINLKIAKKCGITINKDDYKDATFVE